MTAPASASTPLLVDDQEWQRLDPRMLLVHPVREVLRFLPVLAGLLLARRASGAQPWELVGVAVPIALGVLRYLTTRFRISAGRVELRRGLLSRHVTSTPIDRVRTVDLTSSPIHRLLGLTTVRIGTGTASSEDAERLDLDGLPRDRAEALRRSLLRSAPPAPEGGSVSTASAPAAPLVVFDAAWLRFAPFTGGGLVVAAAAFGALSQILNALDAWDDIDPSSWSVGVPSAVAVVVAAMLVLVAVATISVLGYLITNGGFRLVRDAGSWRLSRGLLTTRETTIDQERLAGVVLGEPLALRLTGGRSLTAIVTGVDRKQSGSATLVPPADREVVLRVAAEMLGSSEPLQAVLTRHGPAATRRRLTRALVPAAVGALLVVLGIVGGASAWWTIAAVAILGAGLGLGLDRARGLGHTLADGHLVARSGSLTRRREILDTDHVIGWTFRSTWFQRRAGLTTLVATTAGGGGWVRVPDVPEPDAERLADAALPDLVAQFTLSTSH